MVKVDTEALVKSQCELLKLNLSVQKFFFDSKKALDNIEERMNEELRKFSHYIDIMKERSNESDRKTDNLDKDDEDLANLKDKVKTFSRKKEEFLSKLNAISGQSDDDTSAILARVKRMEKELETYARTSFDNASYQDFRQRLSDLNRQYEESSERLARTAHEFNLEIEREH